MHATLPRRSTVLTDAGRAIAVPVQVRAHRAQRLTEGITSRVARLDTRDETGAQAAEYAMVGGVGACICALFMEFVTGGALTDLLKALFKVLLDIFNF